MTTSAVGEILFEQAVENVATSPLTGRVFVLSFHKGVAKFNILRSHQFHCCCCYKGKKQGSGGGGTLSNQEAWR